MDANDENALKAEGCDLIAVVFQISDPAANLSHAFL
jgi:hypothetical protein